MLTRVRAALRAPGSLYRRELPPSCIAFASPEGRDIFTEALAEGGMESYFHLAEQFRTRECAPPPHVPAPRR